MQLKVQYDKEWCNHNYYELRSSLIGLTYQIPKQGEWQLKNQEESDKNMSDEEYH